MYRQTCFENKIKHIKKRFFKVNKAKRTKGEYMYISDSVIKYELTNVSCISHCIGWLCCFTNYKMDPSVRWLILCNLIINNMYMYMKTVTVAIIKHRIKHSQNVVWIKTGIHWHECLLVWCMRTIFAFV